MSKGILTCSECGGELEVFSQGGQQQGTCNTPGCRLHRVTAPAIQLRLMSDAALEAYRTDPATAPIQLRRR